jgi:hypothetical protein
MNNLKNMNLQKNFNNKLQLKAGTEFLMKEYQKYVRAFPYFLI